MPCCVALELELGIHNPRFVVCPLELGLETHNQCLVVWALEEELHCGHPPPPLALSHLQGPCIQVTPQMTRNSSRNCARRCPGHHNRRSQEPRLRTTTWSTP